MVTCDFTIMRKLNSQELKDLTDVLILNSCKFKKRCRDMISYGCCPSGNSVISLKLALLTFVGNWIILCKTQRSSDILIWCKIKFTCLVSMSDSEFSFYDWNTINNMNFQTQKNERLVVAIFCGWKFFFKISGSLLKDPY